MKGWGKSFQENGPKKQAGVAIIIPNKIDFKPKLIRRDRERHHILLKGKLHQGGISSVPNTRAPTFVNEIL